MQNIFFFSYYIIKVDENLCIHNMKLFSAINCEAIKNRKHFIETRRVKSVNKILNINTIFLWMQIYDEYKVMGLKLLLIVQISYHFNNFQTYYIDAYQILLINHIFIQ